MTDLNEYFKVIAKKAIDDETFAHEGNWESLLHLIDAYIEHLKKQIPKWEPIETANEKEYILGYDPGKEYPTIGIQVMRFEYDLWGDGVYNEWSAHPTHWMKLPELPQ